MLDYALPDQIYGFHAQQACEKFLKALISSHHVTYPFTHKLETLLKLLADCGESLPTFPYPLGRLTPFAAEFRYEIGEALPPEDRVDMRTTAETVRTFVLERILVLQNAQP